MRAPPAMLFAVGGAILVLLGALAWGAGLPQESENEDDSFISIVRIFVNESPSTQFSFATDRYHRVPFGAYELDATKGSLRDLGRSDWPSATGAFLVVRPWVDALGGMPEELALAKEGGGPISIWVNGTASEAIDQRISVSATRAHIHFWRLDGCGARFYDWPEPTYDIASHLYLGPNSPAASVEFVGGASERGACPEARLEFAWIGAWRVG